MNYIYCPRCGNKIEFAKKKVVIKKNAPKINKEEVFVLLDRIIANIHKHKVEPLLSDEMTSRIQRKPELLDSDSRFLKEFADLISYSGARSDLIEGIWTKTNALPNAFCNFDVSSVAALDADIVKEQHWQNVKAMRYKWKVDSIIKCARTLQRIAAEHGSFLNFLQRADIPLNISGVEDLNRFWEQFDYLLAELRKFEMPFLRNDTTLLYLLLNMGYYCVKPDLILLKFADEINVRDKKEFVRLLQEYCLSRQIKPAVIDLYLLIYGGQLGSRQFVDAAYYKKY